MEDGAGIRVRTTKNMGSVLNGTDEVPESNESMIEAYLKRVRFEERAASLGFVPPPPAPSFEHLRILHKAHSETVPFENLSIYAKEDIHIDIPSVYRKIVLNHRGGFCFENNGLFGWAIRQLGYTVDFLQGAVFDPEAECYGHPFDHLCLLVHNLEGKTYFADPSYGRGFMDPMIFEEGLEQEQESGKYRLTRMKPEEAGASELEYKLEIWNPKPKKEGFEGGRWEPGYRFPLTPHAIEEYEEMSQFHQHNETSIFSKGRVITRRRAPSEGGGRITISERKLKETAADGTITMRHLQEGKEYSSQLYKSFGITMGDIYIPPVKRPTLIQGAWDPYS